MPLSTAVFKGSGASLISKINKEMQIRCSKEALCKSGSRALASGKRRLRVLGRAGEGRVCYSGEGSASDQLCGHKAASLPAFKVI